MSIPPKYEIKLRERKKSKDSKWERESENDREEKDPKKKKHLDILSHDYISIVIFI